MADSLTSSNSKSWALEGAPELMRKLKALGALEDGKVLLRAGNAAGDVVVERARALIPKGTIAHRTYRKRLVSPGFASRNIRRVASLSRDKQKVDVRVGVRAEAFYAVSFVEMGTSRMKKQPWLRPAFQSTLDQQQLVMADELRNAILKIARAR